MKIWTISDLHVRMKDAISLVKPDRFPDADVCVIAGDVCDSMHLSVNWAAKVIAPVMPVVFVPGNHEFYDTSIEKGRKDARMIAAAAGVHLLDDSTAVIGGARFVGGTLWTDFMLYADGSDGKARHAMYLGRHSLADYGNVYWNVPREGRIARLLKPSDTLALHRATRAFLEEELARPFDGPTVVVTHHAPHPGSVHAKYANDPVTASFVSDMRGLVDGAKPDLWVHGHVHSPFDYRADGGTRIVCNPRGYGLENPDFEFMKVVKVTDGPAARVP